MQSETSLQEYSLCLAKHYLLSCSDSSLLSLPPASHKPCVTSLALSLRVQGATLSRDRNSTASQCEPDCTSGD